VQHSGVGFLRHDQGIFANHLRFGRHRI
jgi:hypothetical protein